MHPTLMLHNIEIHIIMHVVIYMTNTRTKIFIHILRPNPNDLSKADLHKNIYGYLSNICIWIFINKHIRLYVYLKIKSKWCFQTRCFRGCSHWWYRLSAGPYTCTYVHVYTYTYIYEYTHIYIYMYYSVTNDIVFRQVHTYMYMYIHIRIYM